MHEQDGRTISPWPPPRASLIPLGFARTFAPKALRGNVPANVRVYFPNLYRVPDPNGYGWLYSIDVPATTDDVDDPTKLEPDTLPERIDWANCAPFSGRETHVTHPRQMPLAPRLLPCPSPSPRRSRHLPPSWPRRFTTWTDARISWARRRRAPITSLSTAR